MKNTFLTFYQRCKTKKIKYYTVQWKTGESEPVTTMSIHLHDSVGDRESIFSSCLEINPSFFVINIWRMALKLNEKNAHPQRGKEPYHVLSDPRTCRLKRELGLHSRGAPPSAHSPQRTPYSSEAVVPGTVQALKIIVTKVVLYVISPGSVIYILTTCYDALLEKWLHS